MFTFVALLKAEVFQLKKSMFLWIALIVLLLYAYVGYVNFTKAGFEVGQFLQSTGYIGMAAVLSGLFFGVSIAGKEKKVGFDEVMLSLPGDPARPAAKVVAWLIAVTFITILSIIEIVLLCRYSGSMYLLFWDMLCKYILFYWSWPLLCGTLLGMSIYYLFWFRWWTLLLLFIVWFLLTPLNSVFVSIVPKPLLTWLNLSERQLSSAYSGFEGLPISLLLVTRRLSFFLFCVSLFCFSLFRRKQREKSKKERLMLCSVSALALVVAAVLFAASVSPLDRFHSNTYSSYYLNKDMLYYSSQKKESAEGATFEVDKYEIRLTHRNNEISYVSDIFVRRTDPAAKRLIFTLYHDLKVKSISHRGNPLQWSREGDWVYVECPDPFQEGAVQFAVTGSSGGGSPITETSFFLSSLSPWYPIPGKYTVAETMNAIYEPQFKSIFLNNPVQFHVKVNQKKKVFSNLREVAFNEFEGSSRGVFLASGVLTMEQKDGFEIVAPPDRTQVIANSLNPLQHSVDRVATLLEIPSKKIPKKIFVIPSYSNFTHNYLSYSGDELYINENVTRLYSPALPTALSNMTSVFQAFYWNDAYREADAFHSYLIGLLLNHLESGGKKSLLDLKASDPIQTPVVMLAKKMIGLYDSKGEDSIVSLIRTAYRTLQHHNMTIEDWESLVNNIQNEVL